MSGPPWDTSRDDVAGWQNVGPGRWVGDVAEGPDQGWKRIVIELPDGRFVSALAKGPSVEGDCAELFACLEAQVPALTCPAEADPVRARMPKEWAR